MVETRDPRGDLPAQQLRVGLVGSSSPDGVAHPIAFIAVGPTVRFPFSVYLLLRVFLIELFNFWKRGNIKHYLKLSPIYLHSPKFPADGSPSFPSQTRPTRTGNEFAHKYESITTRERVY
jgi:hypothetical protein